MGLLYYWIIIVYALVMPSRNPSSGEPAPKRARRDRVGLREELLEAALSEFATHGYDGASTLSIARRAGAHQPQINYHFESKDLIWRAAVDHLFAQLGAALDLDALGAEADDIDVLAAGFADRVRRFVRFASEHPELNRIITHEATSRTDRLEWMTERYVRVYAGAVGAVWDRLVEAGVAAPIDGRLIHHVLVGAASLVFVNAPEFELLNGEAPTSDVWVDRHAEGLVAMLLPGLVRATPALRGRSEPDS
jgi:AcrR family transcriptional regulator